MVVFGGLGTFVGPLIGAPAIVIITEMTRDFGSWNMVFYSLAVIVIMRLYREGLVALFRKGIFKLSEKMTPQHVPLPK
jgi:branched-chain amino acid transport system permease protein